MNLQEIKTKPRIFQYDFIRAFAIISVVFIHVFTSFANTSAEIETKEYINTIFRFGTVIFIFLAGFFFRKNADSKYIKDRLKKILIPYTLISIPATAYLIYSQNWDISNWPEIILSYIFGYKFGFYFIFIIVLLTLIGYVLVKTKLIRHTNKLLIIAIIIQFLWLAIDELIYKNFGFYDKYFFQFRLNDLIIARSLFTWGFFFVLGLWYQEQKSKDLISKYKKWFNFGLLASFIILNIQILFNLGDYTPHGSIIWSIFSSLIIIFLLNLNVEKIKRRAGINYISRISYGIYLVHFFIIYLIFELEKELSIDIPYFTTLLISPVVLFLSIGIVEILRRIFKDKSMWVIGA